MARFTQLLLHPFLLFFLLILASPAMSSTTIAGPIKTIVILVMENRSFDHMLGWMKRLNPDIDGVTGSEFNRLSVSDPNSTPVFFTDTAEFVDPDPGHSFQAIREQVFGSNNTSSNPAPMNGFAQQAESTSHGLSSTVMSGFRPEVIPVYSTLAMEFAICDQWFAALPASTQPNRLYVHSATSYGATSNVDKDLAQGYPQKTIFDSLDEAGLSFGIYYQNLPTIFFYRNLRKLKYVTKFHQYGLSFKQHAKAGTLPNYVVIEPRYFDLKTAPANDDHPSHDVSEGQKLVKEVYEVLRASPQWNETLFVITYDEHGGFYDHVPTPLTDVPNPDGLTSPPPFNFNVPTVMFYKSLRKLKYIPRLHLYDTFKAHAEEGSLPNYVVIEPRYFDLPFAPANDDHPSHDVSEGQKLVKEVYEVLRASPQWNETLFVITYDEHGGFYDHVPTPLTDVPNPDGIVGPPPFNFNFDRLGVRVPAFFISPWINKGTVLHAPKGPTPSSQFEHSSVPATVKKIFNLNSGFLTRRDAWAGTFESVLSERATPRTDCPMELPSPPWSLRHSAADETRGLSEFQQELVQLAAQLRGELNVSSALMNIRKANDYIDESMSRFIEAGMAALEDGSTDPSSIIKA